MFRRIALSSVLAAFAASARAAESPKAADPAEAQPAKPALFERLGGLKAISMLVDDFIDRLVNDDLLNANPAIKAGRDSSPAPYLKVQVSVLACQVTGGPCLYSGKDMKMAHAHLKITEPEWAQMVRLLKESLAKFKVQAVEQAEFLAIIESTKKDIVMAAPADEKK